MKKILFSIIFFLIFSFSVEAKVNIATSYTYIADITKQIGMDNVSVKSLGNGNWDPHFVIPKPSLISKLRKADLLIINGAQLEIGWLPPLVRQANNSDIQPGRLGFLDLSQYVETIQVPQNVSRAQGDVHPQGNPHFHLDPYNIPKLANAITNKLCNIDNNNCANYQKNNAEFLEKWAEKLTVWGNKLSDISNKKVIEYHRVYDYFLKRYNIKLTGTLEPLPGIPPTPNHLIKMIKLAKSENVSLNIRSIYNPEKFSTFFSKKSKIKLILLPHDVNSIKGVDDIFSLFDVIVDRLTD